MVSSAPAYIQLFPTLRCNSSCDFCFNRGLPFAEGMNAENLERLVSVMSGVGIGHLDVLGGEPTFHPDLPDLLDSACAKGITVSMSTNGKQIDILRDLSLRYKREQLKIGVSINTSEISQELNSYIMEHRPRLKSVSTNHHFAEYAVLPYLNMPDMTYYLIYMDTLFSTDLERGMPFNRYLDKLIQLKKAYNNIEGVYCSGFLPDVMNYPFLRHVRCPAGSTKLSVMPDGSVYPCYLLVRHHEFRLGNILTDSFEQIWHNPALDFFRRFDRNECPDAKCGLFSECHGGCPAISLLINNTLQGPDPRCVR